MKASSARACHVRDAAAVLGEQGDQELLSITPAVLHAMMAWKGVARLAI
jgi:hypothetical protein